MQLKCSLAYHNQNNLFGTQPDFDAHTNIVNVAVVDTDNLTEAFNSTNHIHSCWMENSCVQAEPGKYRSTSIGDVLEKNGLRYVVESTGFKPM